MNPRKKIILLWGGRSHARIFSSMIEEQSLGQVKVIFDENVWSNYNDKTFKYAECSTCSNRLGLDLYDQTNGFLTEYSKSIASEDMAEVFSFLMTDEVKIKHIAKKDSILLNKIKYIEKGIDKIVNF